MKVLALVLVAVGAASALGSGPYLPSGWRPQGPAFYLPSEVEKPAVALKDAPIQETEASGSDALREYGPPKVQQVSQYITQQGLPDAVTEQAFTVIEAKFNLVEEVKESATAGVTEEVSSEQKFTIQEETVTSTEQIAVEEKSTEAESEPLIQGRSIDVEGHTVVEETSQASVQEEASQASIQQETSQASILEETSQASIQEETSQAYIQEETSQATIQEETSQGVQDKISPASIQEVESTEKNAEITQQETENPNSNIVSAVEERVEKEVVEEVKKVDEGVKNIAEALVNLENEIKAQQVQTIQEVTEVKAIQENSGALQQVPEGFLEYGPPGFKEYGPPKQDELLKSGAILEEPSSNTVESNETRRRRFSPKFRQSRS